MFPSQPAIRPIFGPAFWNPYTPAIRADDYARGLQGDATSPVRYSEAAHGTHAEFCNGPRFAAYKEEMRAQLSFLAAFCRQHQVPEAETIASSLDTFFRHRFDEAHYFSTRSSIVDSRGKQSLDEFCWMIRHDAIGLNTKLAAIRNLALGVTECADGAVSNLVSAARKLALAVGGIRGTLWNIKEETARDTLLAVTQESFACRPDYHPGNEIHYVTTAWNSLAGWYGFESDPDGITMPEAQEFGFLALCAERLRAALVPDRIALSLAETCQARFNAAMAPDAGSGVLAWTPALQDAMLETLRDIGQAFGLTWEDEDRLDAGTQQWSRRESDLRLGSFLAMDQDGDTCACRLRPDPSLIAMDLLRTMADLGLLQEGDYPRNQGAWMAENGTRAALFVYGELCWVAHARSKDAFQAPLWQGKGLEIELATLVDLRRWQDARLDKSRVPPSAAIGQVIRVEEPARLGEMPISWLNDTACAEAFLLRLGQARAVAYLAAHAPAIAAFAAGKRHKLLCCMLRAGMGTSILAVVRQWSSDPGQHMGMVFRLLRDQAIPMLHRALLDRDAPAAVMAWYAPWRDARLFSFVAPRIGLLLGSAYMGSAAFASALRAGRAAPVQAFFQLLKELLKDPPMQAGIKDSLPEVLCAKDFLGAPALAFAMASGHAPVVQAFYSGLTALLAEPWSAAAIRPPLLAALPHLLVAASAGLDSGLAYALANGHSAVIQAFHATLVDMMRSAVTAPWLCKHLPGMLDPKDGWGKPGIVLARERGHVAAAAAFEAIRADPDILPHLAPPAMPPPPDRAPGADPADGR